MSMGLRMSLSEQKKGSVLLIVIFVVALMSTVVMGILQVNTEEVQVMQNDVSMAQAVAIAEAGFNEALAQLRDDTTWTDGLSGQAFASGTYTVTISGHTVTSVGTTAQGFEARVEADVSFGSTGPPYRVIIDSLRINE